MQHNCHCLLICLLLKKKVILIKYFQIICNFYINNLVRYIPMTLGLNSVPISTFLESAETHSYLSLCECSYFKIKSVQDCLVNL